MSRGRHRPTGGGLDANHHETARARIKMVMPDLEPLCKLMVLKAEDGTNDDHVVVVIDTTQQVFKGPWKIVQFKP